RRDHDAMTVASMRIGAAAALFVATVARAQVALPPAVTIEFDEKGAVTPASASARATVPGLLAGRTVVVILSHGRRNDPASADAEGGARLEIGGIVAALPPAPAPLFVKIVWPSAMFPMTGDACEGEQKAPFFASQRPRAAVRDVEPWARAAFPTAARGRRFSA